MLGPLRVIPKGLCEYHIQCRKCGYDLYGLFGEAYFEFAYGGKIRIIYQITCPECGVATPALRPPRRTHTA